MSKAHGPLADRPINPKVGLEISHESADLHVTGTVESIPMIRRAPSLLIRPVTIALALPGAAILAWEGLHGGSREAAAR